MQFYHPSQADQNRVLYIQSRRSCFWMGKDIAELTSKDKTYRWNNQMVEYLLNELKEYDESHSNQAWVISNPSFIDYTGL